MLVPASLLLSLATTTVMMDGGAGQILTDLDGDGAMETVTVQYIGEDKISVERNGQVLLLDTPQDIHGYRPMIEVQNLDFSQTGVPLMVLDVPGGEYCGSGDTTYFVGLGAQGPTLSIQSYDWYDSPAYSSVELAFSPEKRTVTRTQESTDGESTNVEVAVLTYRDGMYR